MDPAVERDAEQLAGARPRTSCSSMFESVHSISTPSWSTGPGRRDRRGGGIAGDIEAGDTLIVRRQRARQRHLLEMNGVEAPVARVVRIEFEADEAARQAGVGRELVEQAGAGTAAVEIQIGRRVLRSRVEDVERPGRSLTKNRPAGPGSCRMTLMRASDPALLPVPSGDPVIGNEA